MGCSNSMIEKQIPQQKNKLKRKFTLSSHRQSTNIFGKYIFHNTSNINIDDNIILYTTNNLIKNQFMTMNFSDKQIVGNSLFKNKNLTVGYYKGFKIDLPNQDKFFIISDGDFEVFCIIDGHGPFGHTVAQYVQEFFFNTICNWRFEFDEKKDKENYKSNNNTSSLYNKTNLNHKASKNIRNDDGIESFLKETFKNCQNSILTGYVCRLIYKYK